MDALWIAITCLATLGLGMMLGARTRRTEERELLEQAQEANSRLKSEIVMLNWEVNSLRASVTKMRREG